jgi:hypothetical protein
VKKLSDCDDADPKKSSSRLSANWLISDSRLSASIRKLVAKITPINPPLTQAVDFWQFLQDLMQRPPVLAILSKVFSSPNVIGSIFSSIDFMEAIGFPPLSII